MIFDITKSALILLLSQLSIFHILNFFKILCFFSIFFSFYQLVSLKRDTSVTCTLYCKVVWYTKFLVLPSAAKTYKFFPLSTLEHALWVSMLTVNVLRERVLWVTLEGELVERDGFEGHS